MAKEKSKNTSRINLDERGITAGKVAHLYGISLDTLQTWMDSSQKLADQIDEEDNEYNFWHRRKWSPKDLEMVFEIFGDPRNYQDIIAPVDQ